MRSRDTAWLRFGAAMLLAGAGAGLGGALCYLLLHGVQRVVQDLDAGAGGPAWRIVLGVALAGSVGGTGWWVLRRFARPIVPVPAAVSGMRMPVVTTVLHAALQIVIVGMGASIGREVAPRELGALFGGRAATLARLTPRQRRILVACVSAAGLSAVYHVPLAGAVFAVEVLLAEFSLATVAPALAVSGIASAVSAIVIPPPPVYSVPHLQQSPSLVVWALVAGPILGVLGLGFGRLTSLAERHRPRSWLLLLTMPVTFALVGALAVAFPQILGNGLALGDTAFDPRTGLGLLGVLALAKAATTVGSIGAGAYGGTLQPGFSIGAALGALLGGVWLLWWPGSPATAFAIAGAAAFLATSMSAPVTALVLAIEFTGVDPALTGAIALAVGTATAVRWLLTRARAAGPVQPAPVASGRITSDPVASGPVAPTPVAPAPVAAASVAAGPVVPAPVVPAPAVLAVEATNARNLATAGAGWGSRRYTTPMGRVIGMRRRATRPPSATA